MDENNWIEKAQQAHWYDDKYNLVVAGETLMFIGLALFVFFRLRAKYYDEKQKGTFSPKGDAAPHVGSMSNIFTSNKLALICMFFMVVPGYAMWLMGDGLLPIINFFSRL